jgi:hypothetical protein
MGIPTLSGASWEKQVPAPLPRNNKEGNCPEDMLAQQPWGKDCSFFGSKFTN